MHVARPIVGFNPQPDALASAGMAPPAADAFAQRLRACHHRPDISAWPPSAAAHPQRFAAQRAWCDDDGRWALLERDVEADGQTLRHPYFWVNLRDKFAHQLMVRAYDFHREPPRLHFVGEVVVTLTDDQAVLRLQHSTLVMVACPAAALAQQAAYPAQVLPFVPRPVVCAELQGGACVRVEASCEEHGAEAVHLRLSWRAAGPLVAAQVQWRRDGSLARVDCSEGSLRLPACHSLQWCHWQPTYGPPVGALSLSGPSVSPMLPPCPASPVAAAAGSTLRPGAFAVG